MKKLRTYIVDAISPAEKKVTQCEALADSVSDAKWVFAHAPGMVGYKPKWKTIRLKTTPSKD